MDAAVSRPEQQHFHAVGHGQDGSTVGRVVRQRPSSVVPDRLTVAFVERDEVVLRLGLIAPADNDRADDDEVAVDDWVVGSPTIGAQQAKLLTERPAPQSLASLAVNALKVSTVLMSHNSV